MRTTLMSKTQETVLQIFNGLNPQVSLSYELFDFPLNDDIYTPLEVGFLSAFFFHNRNKILFNLTFKKGTGLDQIERKLVARVKQHLASEPPVG